MFFSIVGQLAAFVVPLAIIGSMIPANALKVTWTGIGLGVASAMPLLIVFLGTKERMEHQEQEQPSIKESVKAAFTNRPFFFAVGVFLFTNTAFSIIQSILLYFLKYHMHLEEQSDMIMGTVFIVALMSLPFWVWASKHWDKRIAYVIGMVFFSVTMIAMIMLDPSWNPVWIYIMAGLAGIGVGAMDVLPWAMIPDAIEWDELKTGKRHEGMFYSLVTLIGKIDGSIAVPMMLLVMGWTGFVPNAAVQPASAILAIRLMTGLAPSVFLCLGILFALFYPLTRTRHAELRKEIIARQSELRRLRKMFLLAKAVTAEPAEPHATESRGQQEGSRAIDPQPREHERGDRQCQASSHVRQERAAQESQADGAPLPHQVGLEPVARDRAVVRRGGLPTNAGRHRTAPRPNSIDSPGSRMRTSTPGARAATAERKAGPGRSNRRLARRRRPSG